MVRFIKGDENLFRGTPGTPPTYLKGIIINLCWLILLALVSFFLFFKRSLHHLKKREIKLLESNFKTEFLELDKGDFRVLFSEGDQLSIFLYNVLTGEIKKLRRAGFSEELPVNGVDICKKKNKEPFFYISITRSFPDDLKVIDILKFIFRLLRVKKPGRNMILENEKIKPYLHQWIKQLKIHRRFELVYLVLELLKNKYCVFLIDDTAEILPNSCLVRLKELLEQLKEDAVVIYVTQPQVVGIEGLKPGECFVDGDVWFRHIEKIRNESEVRDKLKNKEGRKQ
jgi:hypothetical protein